MATLPSSQLYPNQRDDSLQCLLDDRGLAMADDDESLSLVAAAGCLPDRRQLRLHDQRSDLASRLFHAMQGLDATFTLTAEEGHAGRVLSRRRLERAEGHQAD